MTTDKSKEYNGWKNYETWNVALWIQNDEARNSLAKKAGNYIKYVIALAAIGETQTPDGVSYADDTLDLDALNALIREL
jgi:hypothetical protein